MSYTVCKLTPLPGETEAGVPGCPPQSMAEPPGHGAGQWAKGAGGRPRAKGVQEAQHEPYYRGSQWLQALGCVCSCTPKAVMSSPEFQVALLEPIFNTSHGFSC